MALTAEKEIQHIGETAGAANQDLDTLARKPDYCLTLWSGNWIGIQDH